MKAKEFGDNLRLVKENKNSLKKQELIKVEIPNFHIQEMEGNYWRKKKFESSWTIVSKCPVLKELYVQYAGTKYGNNGIIKKLLKGEWNGKIYEYKPNHFDLFINEERYFIFPENYNDLNDGEKMECMELHELVIKFREYKEKFFNNPCDYCNLFKGYFYNKNRIIYDKETETRFPISQIKCGYKKGMKIEEHFIFPSRNKD